MEGKIINKEVKIQKGKKKLLTATAKLLRSHGYEALTVRNICKEADFPIGAFYRYFTGKDELVTFYFFEGFRLYVEKNQDHDDFSDPRKAIINAIVFFADYFQSMGLEFISSCFSPKNQSLDMIHIKNVATQKQGEDYFLTQLQALQEQRMIRKNCDIQELHEELNVIIDGIIFNWCLKKGAYDLPAMVKKMCTSYLNSYLKPELAL
jgi:AcrR family transcriptional regulator